MKLQTKTFKKLKLHLDGQCFLSEEKEPSKILKFWQNKVSVKKTKSREQLSVKDVFRLQTFEIVYPVNIGAREIIINCAHVNPINVRDKYGSIFLHSYFVWKFSFLHANAFFPDLSHNDMKKCL